MFMEGYMINHKMSPAMLTNIGQVKRASQTNFALLKSLNDYSPQTAPYQASFQELFLILVFPIYL